METIGKEGDLRGQEREERTLEETHGGDEWQRLKHGPKSQAPRPWLKPAPVSGYRFLSVSSAHSFLFSVGRANKVAILTLAVRSCPFPLGGEGLVTEKTAGCQSEKSCQ